MDIAAAQPGYSKMAVVLSRGTDCAEEESIADQDQTASPAAYQSTTVSTPLQVAPSPASTESLLGRSLEGPVMTPLQELLTSPDPWDQDPQEANLTPQTFSP